MQDWKAFFERNVSSPSHQATYMNYVERLSSKNFPVIFSLEHLSALVGIKLGYCVYMLMQPESFYREFAIPKRNGGRRIISAPYPSLLSCQQWISTNIVSRISVHESAHGFVPQRSIVTNAEPHLGCDWLLRIDIKDFFPSIDIRRIVWIFKQCGYARDVSFFLARLCTLNEKLPQGSAASPQLSNIAFTKTDGRLAALGKCWEVKYTRYADDLTFSGRYIPSKFINIVYEILQSEGFTPNTEKTRLIGPKGRKIVTGVSVSGNMLKLPKETKRQVRKEAYYLWRMGFEHHTKRIGSYDPIYAERLLGKLAFWRQIEPRNQYVNQSLARVQAIRAQLNGLGVGVQIMETQRRSLMDNVPKNLVGDRACYEIMGKKGDGKAGQTFRAKVTQLLKDGVQLSLDQEVIVKVPRIDDKLSYLQKKDLCNQLYALTQAEYETLQKLKGLDCVARVLDCGIHLMKLRTNVETPVIFIVQDYIIGEELPEALKQQYNNGGAFSGVPNGDEFFRWALPLAQGLLRIHQCQVIHGDIWPSNFIVRKKDGVPVFIDFGQAIFRDLGFDQGSTEGRNSAYIAPERMRSVSGDIYSLGGVLFFLATGEDPFKPIEDIDELKSAVVEAMKTANFNLFRDNRGIADIIARCLRYGRHGRITNAAGLLEDIETFQRARAVEPIKSSYVSVDEHRQKLETINNPFFTWIADLRARSLVPDLEDMFNGVYDLNGGHETLVSALTQYVSILEKGDKYLTMSTPKFWFPQNLGLNGRFLAMNTLKAQHGVTIRRIFLVTEDELAGDRHLQKVLAVHIREMEELREIGVETRQSEISAGGYYTCYQIVEKDDREKLIQHGNHFGLIIKGQCRIVMYPIYREDGTLVTLQFRVGEEVIGPLEKAFVVRLATAYPIESLKERLEWNNTET